METLRACARYRTRHAAHYLRDIHLLYESSGFGAAICRLAQSLPPPPSRLLYAPPLWTLELPPTDLHIPDMSRKNDTPVLAARQFALDHLNSVHGQRKGIFTDGSVVCGASSAAFYIPHSDTTQTFKLLHETSSTEAELTAIYEALNAISETFHPSTFILVLAFISLTHTKESTKKPPKVAREAAILTNNLALSLFRRIAKADDNILVSPYSISTAFAMVYLGTRGATSTEVRKFFQLENLHLQNSHIHDGFRKLSHHLENCTSLKTANVLLSQETYPVIPFFTFSLKEFYNAYVQRTLFESDSAAVTNWVNAWVRWKTGDGVQKVLHRPPDSDTSLMLLNAIYFRDKWADVSTQKAGYHPALQSDVTQFKYRSGNLSFYMIAPRNPDHLEQVEESLSFATLEDIDAYLTVNGSDVGVPKFRIEEQYDLKSAFMSMGLRSVFAPFRSDMTGISNLNDLYLSKVLHRVVMEVGPRGTEALALTFDDAEADYAAGRAEAHRPFVFFVRDQPSGVVLFLGSVRKLTSL
ncbi:leukocyte elastase inhibitor-like [Ornithodoros turicata]|uniref:leukocyte elastase inhibitor-like n=1 Tax=Ornithodoros turicata TaxID=34597 RepID=UPI0031387076